MRSHLSEEAQKIFIERYSAVLDEGNNDGAKAEQVAWKAIHQQFDEDENGIWSKAKVSV